MQSMSNRWFLNVLCVIVAGTSNVAQAMNLTSGERLRVKLPPFASITLRVPGVPDSASYISCQVHTQAHNVSLSMSAEARYDTSVTGSDVGVVTVLESRQTEVQWYLSSQHNFSITVVILTTAMTDLEPLPGGCNTEFNLENDANFDLHTTDYLIVLTFQWSAVGFRRGSEGPWTCLSKKDQDRLTYDVYIYYLRENDLSEQTFLTALANMMTVQSIQTHGTKLTSLQYGDKSSISLTSYRGQGAILNVIVTQDAEGSSTYFPVTTYGCNFINGTDNNCHDMLAPDVAAIILTLLAGIVGLFICFVGHRFFKTEMFIFGFLALGLVLYILLFTLVDVSLAVCLGLVGGLAVIGGALWLLVWWRFGFPVLSVLLVGLVAGFAFSCLAFFTPLGGLKYWNNRFNFGMSFGCGVLIMPVILLIFTRMLNILSCAFVGSFAAVLAADTCLRSSLKYIVLNAFRRFSVQDYNSAIQIVPFQINDIILSVVWSLLFISGTVFQYLRERKRPPFPPCPHKKRQARVLYHRQQVEQDSEDENRPLLVNTTQRQSRYTGETTDRTNLVRNVIQ